jgi:hypothetical protein
LVHLIEATHRKTELKRFKEYFVEPSFEMKLEGCGFVMMNDVAQQQIWKDLAFDFAEIGRIGGLDVMDKRKMYLLPGIESRSSSP